MFLGLITLIKAVESYKKYNERRRKYVECGLKTSSDIFYTEGVRLVSKKKRPPATTPEAREAQMINLATKLAEKQLIEGTASSQVITHYLKLGTSKEKIEKDILKEQRELIKAKTEAMRSAKRVEELYQQALDAMRSYSGSQGDVDEEEL